MSSGRVGKAIVLICFFHGLLRPAQKIAGGFLHGRLRTAQESMGQVPIMRERS